MLSSHTTPPFKPLKPLNSARKPAFFSNETSRLIAGDEAVNSHSFKHYEGPTLARMVMAATTQHQIYSSNVPSTHRSNALTHRAPGYEIAVDDFVTNVESIKPVNENTGSAYQANSNSLFI